MKSWKVVAPQKIEQITAPSSEVSGHQVKIKINNCALSFADSFIYNQSSPTELPRTIGRICAGMVVEIGQDVTEFSRGDRIVTLPIKYCESCYACKEGNYNDCVNREYFGWSTDGFMRDFAVVGDECIMKIPDRIKDNKAVFLDAISLAVDVISTLNIEKGEHIVISDAGLLGQLIAQIALYNQAIPIVIDIKEKPLENATENGIYYTIDAIKSDPLKKVHNITGGKMSECVALISGNSSILPAVFKYASHSGRVALVNVHGKNVDMPCNLNSIIERNLSIYGISSCRKSMSVAINMLANKVTNVEKLIGREIEFDSVGEVLESPSAINIYNKVIVKI